jgi:ketosteroid isomerase-like protein
MKYCIISLFLMLSLSSLAQEAKPIVVQNLYFPKPGKEEEVYQWRLHASAVRKNLGLPEGRVLKKLSGDALYYVIWECDYPSLMAREADVKALDQSEEFKNVQAHMSTLIQKFERNVWEVQAAPDEIQIRQKRVASNEAIAAHDAAGISNHWSRDILVLTSRNRQNVGKQQNADAFAKEFKAKQELVYIRTPEKIVVFSAAGMASETGTWVGRWQTGAERVEVTGTYYAKWIKSETQWLIRAEIYTPLTCRGDSYCRTFVK